MLPNAVLLNGFAVLK